MKLFREYLELKRRELSILNQQVHEMSVLTDAITRLGASVGNLTTAVNNIPPPVDETAAAAAINTQSDAIDALTAKVTPAP